MNDITLNDDQISEQPHDLSNKRPRKKNSNDDYGKTEALINLLRDNP